MAIAFAVTTVISLAAKGIDHLVHKVENAKKKMDESNTSYKSSISELESINSELEKQSKRMDELDAKEKLTYAEKGELENLKEITKELEYQKVLKENEANRNARQAVADATDLYRKQFGKNPAQNSEVDDYLVSAKLAGGATTLLADNANINMLIAAYKTLITQKEEALGVDEEAYENYSVGAQFAKDRIDEQLDGYNEIKKTLTSIPYDELTSDQRDTLNAVNESVKTIWSYIDPNKYNSIQLSDVFNTEGIEKTKDELIQMAKEGKVDESTISSYKNLNRALSDSNLILKNGENAFSVLCNEINALAADSALSVGDVSISFEELESRINSVTDSQSLFNDAISEQNENGTLSAETVAKLRDNYSDLDKVLEVTSSGIQLNTTELTKFNAKEKENLQNDISKKYKELIDQYNASSMALSVYNSALEDGNSFSDEQRKKLEDLINARQRDCDATMGQITDLRYLQAEFDNSISKYNAFKNALSSKDSGDNYDTIQSSLKQVQETWDKGLVGKDEIRAFVDYMTYQDMSTASVQEIASAYQNAMKSAKDYFTEGQEGSMRFVKQLEKLGLATEGTDHSWSVNISNMDEAAEKCGISVDALQDQLQKLKDYGAEFDFDLNDSGIIDTSGTLKEINSQISDLEEKINTDALGFDTDELKHQLKDLYAARDELQKPIDLIINHDKAIQEIQDLQVEIDRLVSSGTGSGEKQALKLQDRQNRIASEQGITVEAALKVTTDDKDAKDAIDRLQEFEINDKEFNVIAKVDLAQKAIDNLVSKPYTAYIAVKLKTEGVFAVLSGIAAKAASKGNEKSNASWQGSAFTDGSWKVGYTGRALVGELGKELLVRNGKTIPIGENGAEYFNVKSDDIIFNHAQTEQLEKYGHISTRGKAFANGSVPTFSGINNPSVKTSVSFGFSDSSGKKYKDISSDIKKASKSAEKLKEETKGTVKETKKESKEFDWIQTAIDHVERKRQNIADIIEDENVAYEHQLSLINELLANDEEVIQVNKSALDNYKNQWEEIRKKIIETFGEVNGNALLQKVVSGDTSIDGWLDKIEQANGDNEIDRAGMIDDAISIYSSLTDQEDKYEDAVKQHTEDLQKQFEIRVNMIKAGIDEIDAKLNHAESRLSLKETTGRVVTESDYRNMIKLAEDQVDLYREQRDVLRDQLSELDEGSAEWYSIKSEIASCSSAIDQCEQNQAEWNEEILNIPIKRIERYLELLGNIRSDLENFISEQESLGKITTQDQYQNLIDISQEQLEKLLEKQEELKNKLSNYDFGSDKYNETQNNLQDVDNEISSIIQSQNEWNQSILNIPVNKINETNETLQKVVNSMDDVLSDYNTAINAATGAIDDEIDSVNELKDATTKAYEEQIKPIQEIIDNLKKANDERSRQLALEQAEYDFQRAISQKTTKVSKIACFYRNVKYVSSYIG